MMLLALAGTLGLFVPVAADPGPRPAVPRTAAASPANRWAGMRLDVRIERDVAPSPAHPEPQPALAEELFELTNGVRVARGLPPLRWWAAALGPAARAQTDRMVAADRLFHNPDLDALLYRLGARTIGENVGLGPDVASIQRAFMRSPKHRANILNSEFRLGAVYAVRHPAGGLFVTVIFGRAVARPVAG